MSRDAWTYYQDESDFTYVKLQWESATVTRLRGTLEPRQMQKDFTIQCGPPESIQAVFHSYSAAKQKGFHSGLLYFVATLFLVTIIGLGMSTVPRRLSLIAAVAALMVGCLIGGGTYLGLEKIPTEEILSSEKG